MFKSVFSCLKPSSKRSTVNSERAKKPQSAYEEPLDPSFSCLIPEIQNRETCFTFKVDEVEPPKKYPSLATADKLFREQIFSKVDQGKATKITGNFEDCSHREDLNAKYVDCQISGMVAAIHTAYQGHYALSLSVSDFIIVIGQGLGLHINKNAEKLRGYFVDHEGKETIEIERSDFVLGDQNDWSTVFEEFSEQIQKKTKVDVYDVIIDDTSVATVTSRIVSEITLMEAVKSYFSYEVRTKCGIPQVTLEGKPEDWQKLKDKVRKLVEMNKDDCLGLKWWLDELVPVVDKICGAGIERKVDKEFWSSIYKYPQASGGPYIGGWIVKFFPYLSSQSHRSYFGEITVKDLPKQICEVPFVWHYYGREIPMKLAGGFLGAEFDKELCQAKPTHFWCITRN